MKHLFVSSPFYTLIFPLIANRSSTSRQLHFNFCYFYFGILSSLLMTFMSHFDQLQLYPCSSTNPRLNKFIISPFHPDRQIPKYYNDTWCPYVPLRLLVPYTFSGRGVTGSAFLGNPLGHLSIHTIRLLGLCSDQSPLGPYDPHIMLRWCYS